MTEYINRLAWFGVALTILFWAILPKIALANAVYFPPPPKVETTLLPIFEPPPATIDADAEG